MGQTENLVKRSMTLNVVPIFMEFPEVDLITLTTYSGNEIQIEASNEFGGFSNFILEEREGVAFVKSIQTWSDQVESEDKVCSIQPKYPKFFVKIPQGKEVKVKVKDGNIAIDSFVGRMGLELETGKVEVEKYSGELHVSMNNGNIVCAVSDSKLDVESRLGYIKTELQGAFEVNSKHQVKGIVGLPKSLLKIEAVNVFVELIK